ncbi:hypothetical protein NYE92_01555 [Pantoea sp. B566]|nr:hypothetical protein [Pantoea sp. B566]MCS3401431.1 hypothetical protein [Pantoea sp. B566]
MDRQIVYPGAIPLETDLLNTNKFAMTGMAKLAVAVLGSDTCLYGLHCTPDSPASLRVIVGPGQIYSLQNMDNSPYSSLPTDTSQLILKQGLICEATPLTLTAPASAGHSMNYLVQVGYEDVDSDETILPYYNAANPAVAYSGPGNSGKAQPGKRSGVCRLVLKAGVSSPTGSQVTPQPDAGYVAAWGITVTAGMSAITEASIFMIEGAPFLPSGGIYPSIQQCAPTFAHDSGTANRYSASYKPVLAELTDGMRLTFKAREANTGACTFSANGGKAYPLYSHAHQELQGGEIINGGLIEVQWNSSLNAWLMCGNTGGATPVSEAQKPHHAISLAQADKRYLENNKGYSKEDAAKDFLSKKGGVVTGELDIKGKLTAEKIFMGNMTFSEDGNINGPRWKTEESQANGYLSSWVMAELKKISDKIIPFPSTEEITKNCVKRVRLGAEVRKKGEAVTFDAGYVMTGFKNPGKVKKGYEFTARPLQIFVGNRWQTIEQG